MNRIKSALTRERDWQILLLDTSVDDLISGRPLSITSHLQPPGGRRFWADPFPVRDTPGDTWVLAEEFDKVTGLGSIVGIEIGHGRPLRTETLVTGSHHYSFPQAHRTDEGWIGTVETCGEHNVFTFDRLGDRWQPIDRGMPWGLVDPAMCRIDSDRWALTAVRRGHRHHLSQFLSAGAVPSDFEEIDRLGFYSPATARGGGNLDATRGLRVVQDCEKNYGLAVDIMQWSTSGQRESLRRIDGDDLPDPLLGTHTLAWTADGGLVVMDAWSYRRRWDAGLIRVNERRHKRFCHAERRHRRQRRHLSTGTSPA